MSGLNGDWYEALKGEFAKPYYRKLFATVNEEYKTRLIFPPAKDIFNAFHLTPLKDVKVVILGQDPYHNHGQAHGLCFSVQKGVEIPPSLVNIYKELHDDLGCTIPDHGCLTKWAEQGVLMLNTVLTVRAHQANSHRGIGWEEFTDAAIMALNSQDRPIVFILWGAPAQRKKRMLNIRSISYWRHRIRVRCLRTEDSLEADHSVRRMHFLKRTGSSRSTGRLTEPGKRVKSGSSEWKLPDFLRKLLYFGDKKPSNSTGKLSRTLDAGKIFSKDFTGSFRISEISI